MALRPIDWESAYSSWGEVSKAFSPYRITEILDRWIPAAANPDVLELGCAPGRWLQWYERAANANAFGIDLSIEGLHLTRHASPSIQVGAASAMSLPFRAESFDVVFSAGLLEHFEQPQPIVREAFRVLRPGGLMITVVPNIAKGTFQGWHWRVSDRENFDGHRTFTLDELVGEIAGAGFEVLHREYNGLYAPRAQRAIMTLRLDRLARRLEVPRLSTSLAVIARRVH